MAGLASQSSSVSLQSPPGGLSMRPSHLDPPQPSGFRWLLRPPAWVEGLSGCGGQRSREQLCCRCKGLGSAPGTTGTILNQKHTKVNENTPLVSQAGQRQPGHRTREGQDETLATYCPHLLGAASSPSPAAASQEEPRLCAGGRSPRSRLPLTGCNQEAVAPDAPC